MNSAYRKTALGKAHRAVAWALCIMSVTWSAHAETLPVKPGADVRIRAASYSSDRVYRLVGYVGYQIDLEFESDEVFVGLGAGDIEGLSFAAQGNHLFLKPKAAKVRTNLTVLTNRREYQFDYTASADRPDSREPDVIYALRFTYPRTPILPGSDQANRIERQLASPVASRPLNFDYWFCGQSVLKPVAASDDGVHTRLRFGARAELPAVFIRNDDGSESLLNFSMESGDVVIHRVARQFIVRRGRLTGCIVNKAYNGGGERLDSGTVAPAVERVTQGERP